jgi:hypothetical protein
MLFHYYIALIAFFTYFFSSQNAEIIFFKKLQDVY